MQRKEFTMRRRNGLHVSRIAGIFGASLERIGGLYATEKEIRGRSADERLVARQERSRPIIEDLEHWLRAKLWVRFDMPGPFSTKSGMCQILARSRNPLLPSRSSGNG